MTDALGTRLEAALGVLVQRRHRARLYAQVVAESGVPLDEALYPVLSGLARTGPVTAARLGEQIGVDRSVASRHASRLQELGLISREPDPADARATLLVLTDRGTAAIARLRASLAAVLGRQLRDWPPGEAEAFVAGLERFIGETQAVAPQAPGRP